jgi:hypothetical protein
MKVDKIRLSTVILAVILGGSALGAQTFNSGSNGSDGALDLTGQSGTLVFNPASFNPPLDPDHDNVYHFTTITIPSNVTVKLTGDVLGSKPVVWLASGAVNLGGGISLSGGAGHGFSSSLLPAKAGAGGYPGGTGETASQSWKPGQGPGAARGPGGGGGHATSGNGAPPGLDGPAYGNDFLLPLVGGSGGAGGTFPGSGGGGGGGALLIASSVSITYVNIDASGGDAGGASSASTSGGGGSGGAIRLIAPIIQNISGGGTLLARGGQGYSFSGTSAGSPGRIRLEAFQINISSGTLDPAPSTGTPGPVFPPASAPAVRIVSIAGVAVPANPTASFVTPDVTLDNTTTATIQLAGSKVPVGTIVHLTLTPETGAIVNVDSTPLAGTFDSSTATASVTIPHGFSRFSVQASWTP